MKPEVILALDVDSFKQAKSIVDKTSSVINIFKVGAQLFTGVGPEIIDYINKKRAEVFLDLKYFDIPNTVAHAVRQAVSMKIKMLTLHILGDEEMIKAAIEAADEQAEKEKKHRPLLIGVTVLTSKETNSSDVLTLAKLGIECGLDGVVCSVREVEFLRKEIKNNFVIVTPGIRPSGAEKNDQKRTATVAEAVGAGSNYLVIGRPILEAEDPLEAAEDIVRSI